MSLNAAVIEVLVAKGMSAADILEVARASEAKADRTNAERQARHRAKKRNAVTVTVSPLNDIYSNPPEPCEAKASPPPFEKLVEEWNAGPAANGARKATKLDANRKALLKARLRDHSEAEVFGAIANLAASKFHCGENDRNWRAGLGWFLEAKNFVKALEMAEPERKSIVPVVDHAAYLASLNAKPWANASTAATAGPARRGSTGPPRPIGDLIQMAGR